MTATAGLSLPFFTGSAEASHNPRVEVWTGDDVNALWTTSPKLTGDAEVRWSPVTIAGPLSNVEDNPAHVRLRNVRDDGFDIKAEEWDDSGYGHYPEKTHAIHIEEDTDETGSGHIVSAKTVTASDDDWSYWTPPDEVSVGNSILLATIQTHNGGQSVVPRIDSYVGYYGSHYKVKMQKKETYDNGHVQETIGLLSIEKGQGTIEGRKFEAGTWTWPDGALGWRTIEFDRSYPGTTPPMFLADIQTFNGGDTCNLRYRNLTHDSVEITLEEETSADPEIGHTNEEIGYLVMESPYISPKEEIQMTGTNEAITPYPVNEVANAHYLICSTIECTGGADSSLKDGWDFGFRTQAHGTCRGYDPDSENFDTPEKGWKANLISK